MTVKKALGDKAEDLFSEDAEEWGDLNGLSNNLIVKTKEYEVLSSEAKEADSKVKAELSEELSIKSKGKTEDLIDKPKETKVFSQEAKEGNLGIKPEPSEDLTLKSEVKTEELIDKPGESQDLTSENEEGDLRVKTGHTPELSLKSEVISKDSKVLTTEKPEYLRGLSLNEKAMESAIEDARRNPRIGIYSPISSAVLKYNKKTIPEFSISDDARLLLEDSVARKYPELARNLAFERGTARPEANESNSGNFDMDILNRAAIEAIKNPKLTVWSPYAYAVFKYLRKTMPEFSMSQEASSLLDEAVARKYPGLSQALREKMRAV